MTFQLSPIPEIQKEQLKELVHTSEVMLAKLTAPVQLFSEDELLAHNNSKYTGMNRFWYNPPSNRFAKISYY